jgi:hypothetical protein
LVANRRIVNEREGRCAGAAKVRSGFSDFARTLFVADLAAPLAEEPLHTPFDLVTAKEDAHQVAGTVPQDIERIFGQ